MVFDAPYNQTTPGPRLQHWSDWTTVIQPLLGKLMDRESSPNGDGAGAGVGYGRGEYGRSDSYSSAPDTPIKDNNHSNNLEGLLGAFKCSLDAEEDLASLTLTDDSETFLEDLKGVRAAAEKEVREKGIAQVKVELRQKASERQRVTDHADRNKAIEGGADDVFDIGLFRQSYRQWRKERVNAARKK